MRKTLTESPDLILMDVSLPDVSGLELARTIKTSPETTKIPIIACSGWTQREIKTEAYKVGIVEFLTKPIVAVDLIEAIGRHA